MCLLQFLTALAQTESVSALPVPARLPALHPKPQEIITLRGNCELSSRTVFLRLFSAAASGCTTPLASVALATRVCSPGGAPSHLYVKSFHAYWPPEASTIAFCH